MATPESEWMAEFLGQLAHAPSGDFPDWEDASDLGRLHVDEFAQSHSEGFPERRSHGSIRLTGRGVRGNTIDMEDAGRILTEFQTLVTSAGAAWSGIKTHTGRLPDTVVQGTRLLLSASPMPGSVVLDFEPATGDATSPDEPATPAMIELVEESIDLAFEVLGLAASPEVQAVGPERLEQLGPRVAAAAKAFMETAAKAYVDVNATWERPSIGRKRVELTAVESARFWEVLNRRGTDVNQRLIDGVLRTISDRRKIELEITERDPTSGSNENRIISIDRGQLDFSPFRIGDAVSIIVLEASARRPGAAETKEYVAIAAGRPGELEDPSLVQGILASGWGRTGDERALPPGTNLPKPGDSS